MAFGFTSKSKDDPALHKDIMGLKLMMYTAVILLAGGFFYYHNALESAQEEFHREIQETQSQVDLLMQDRALGYGKNNVEETLIEMKGALANLEEESERVQQLAQQVQEESDEFLEAYRQQFENRPLPGEGTG